MKAHDLQYVQQKLQTSRRVSFWCGRQCSARLCMALIIFLDLQRTERLQASLHFLGSDVPSSHVVYVDDERAVRRLTSAQHFNTPAELLGRCHNRPTAEQLSTPMATSARYCKCNVGWCNVFVCVSGCKPSSECHAANLRNVLRHGQSGGRLLCTGCCLRIRSELRSFGSCRIG